MMPHPTNDISGGVPKIYWLIYLLAVCFWMIVSSFIVAEAPGGDIFIMKDAGVNLALGRGYVSCAQPDNPTLELKPHAGYPPVYLMLYAGYVSVFGLGELQNSYFELACRALRNASLLFIVFLIVDSTRVRKLFFAFCCLTIPMSIGISDRPEDISMAMAMLSVGLVYSATRIQGVIFASLLTVVDCFTFPFGGGTTLVACSALLVIKLHQQPELRSMRWLAAWFLPLIGLGVSICLLLLVFFPEVVQRFFIHATQTGGLNYVATGSGRNHWAAGFWSGLTNSRTSTLKVIAFLLAAVLNVVFFWRYGNKKHLPAFLLLMIIFWIIPPLFIFVRSFEYRLYAALTLTAFAAFWIISQGQKRQASRLFCLVSIIVLLPLLPTFTKNFVARCLLAVSSDYDPSEIHRYIPVDPQRTFHVAIYGDSYFDLKKTNDIYYMGYAPLDESVKYFLIVDDPRLLATTHQSPPILPSGYKPEEWEVIHRPDFKPGPLLSYFLIASLLKSDAETVYRRKSP